MGVAKTLGQTILLAAGSTFGAAGGVHLFNKHVVNKEPFSLPKPKFNLPFKIVRTSELPSKPKSQAYYSNRR